MTKRRACTIAIEGSVRSGKHTQIMLMQSFFRAQGKQVATLSFPSMNETVGSMLIHEAVKSSRAHGYNFLNANPKEASLMYASDRIGMRPKIEKLIASHDVVIFDGYVEANLVYQGGKLRPEEREAFGTWVYSLEYVLNNIPKPDVVLYFSLPFAVTARRIQEEKDAGKAIDILEQSEQYIRNSHSAGEFYAQLFDWSVVNCTTEKDGVVYERTQEEIRDEVFRILIKRLP